MIYLSNVGTTPCAMPVPIQQISNAGSLYNVSSHMDSFWESAQSIMPTTVPSLRSIAGFALTLFSTQQVLGGTPSSCPVSDTTPISCKATAEKSCCFNSPGGLLLQTQFWDAKPAVGPVDSWTLHGLWWVDLMITQLATTTDIFQ